MTLDQAGTGRPPGASLKGSKLPREQLKSQSLDGKMGSFGVGQERVRAGT